MVQAIINLGDFEDRILMIVKGKYGLRNKSEAVNLVIDKFQEVFLEPQLKPEYKEELSKITKGKFKRFSSIDDLRREIENVRV
ncbi:MAG: antitoxin [Candidatus Woesearchaeota archaeon]